MAFWIKKLNIEENPVFLKYKISDQEFKILLEEEYKQVNQFSVKEQKLVTALVRPLLNHSATHTFLVWDTIRLLKDWHGVKKVESHLTKEADITFWYAGKLYAIEIETGTLLEKPKQLAQKVAYLNKKYEKRWMFIVSNKDLYWQYRKLGFSTQRNEVEKNLEILLQNG